MTALNAGITNSTFSGNTASQGGAIANSFEGVMQIVNSTLSSNSAANLGGGIWNGNELLVLNSTFHGDYAPQAGGIYNGSSLAIGSTILDEPGGQSLSNLFGVSGSASLGYNLCSDDGGGLLTAIGDRINTDARLGPLQDNGGPTLTHAPLTGSPAIDQGKNLSDAITDQRGFARTFDKPAPSNSSGGDATDIGAVEVMPILFGDFRNATGEVEFRFTDESDQTIVIEASTNLLNWNPVMTNTVGASPLRFKDSTPQTLPSRFYRARVQ